LKATDACIVAVAARGGPEPATRNYEYTKLTEKALAAGGRVAMEPFGNDGGRMCGILDLF
jgi:hypothetical protein